MLNQRQFTFLGKFDFEHLVIWFHLNCENHSLMRAIKSMNLKYPSFNSGILVPHCHLIRFWHGIHRRKKMCCKSKIIFFKTYFESISSRIRHGFLLLSILWMIFSCLPLDLCFHRFVQQPLSLSAFSSSLPPSSSSTPSDCLISVSNFPLFVSLSVYRERSVFFSLHFVFAFFFNNRFLFVDAVQCTVTQSVNDRWFVDVYSKQKKETIQISLAWFRTITNCWQNYDKNDDWWF